MKLVSSCVMVYAYLQLIFLLKKKKKANTKKATLKENPINFKTNGYPNF